MNLHSSGLTDAVPFVSPGVASWAAAGCHASAIEVERYNGHRSIITS